MLNKLREAGLSGNNLSSLFNQSGTQLPSIVQKQEALKNEGDRKSPFLQEQERFITPRVPLVQPKAPETQRSFGLTRNYSQATLQQSSHKRDLEGTMLSEMKKNYLPIDAYDPYYLDDVTEGPPASLIDKYRDSSTGLTMAVSKWFFSSSNQQTIPVYG